MLSAAGGAGGGDPADPRSAAIALAVAIISVVFGKIDRPFLKRMVLLALLLALTSAPLPFTIEGETRWQWGSVILTAPGVDLALTWWFRGMCAACLVLGLLAPLPLWRLLQAAGWWRCPQVLLVLVMLVQRHGSALAVERRRLAEAAALRGWRLSPRIRPLGQLGGMLGALLVRCERRASGVAEAMALRGFTGNIPQPQWPALGVARAAAAFVLAIALIGAGILPWLIPS